MNKLLSLFLLSAFLFSFIGLVNALPIINDLNITPELDISYFGNYTIFADINNYNISSVTIDINGINGEGIDCWEYSVNGTCFSEPLTYDMSYIDGNLWQKTLIRPDHIYPEIMFADSNTTWYNEPLNFDLYRQSYSVFYIENPFIMDENMNFWVEFNTLAKANNSSDLYVYLVAKDQSLNLFTSDWRANENVQLIATFNKNELHSHTHTANSGHILVPLTTNVYGNIGDKNIDISDNFYLVLYQDAVALNRGWNLRYHSSDICENDNHWFIGNRTGGTWSLPIYQNGCPDVHFHLARRVNYIDGVSLSLNVQDTNNLLTYDANFYFSELPNLAPNSTSFLTPLINASYGSTDSNIFISWNKATDPNNDDLNYKIYLEIWDGNYLSHPLINTQDLNYYVTIPPAEQLPDGEYTFVGEVCDYEFCTTFYLDGNFILDRVDDIYSLSEIYLFSTTEIFNFSEPLEFNQTATIGEYVNLLFAPVDVNLQSIDGNNLIDLNVEFYITGELVLNDLNISILTNDVNYYLVYFLVDGTNPLGQVSFKINAQNLNKQYTIPNNPEELNSVEIVSYFSNGSGTLEDPYEITSCFDLNAVRNYLDANFVLTQDINCYDTINWGELISGYCEYPFYYNQEDCELEGYSWYSDFNEGFEPIGDYNLPFDGSFDGNGFSITDLIIKRYQSTDANVGLFGYTSENAEIFDLNLFNVIVWGYERTGALVGRNLGVINNVVVSGIVQGFGVYTGGIVGGSLGNIYDSNFDGNVIANNDLVGGIVGATYGDINNCHSSGIVITNLHGDDGSIGGLVGALGLDAIVNYSSSSSDVNGFFATGGLVGSSLGDIHNSFSTGSVFGEYDYTGGLVGSLSGDVNNCYSISNVTQLDYLFGGYTGGLIGVSSVDSGKGRIYDSYANGNVIGIDRVGGLIGATDSNIYNSYATGNVFGNDEKIGGLIGSMQNNFVYQSYADGNVSGADNVGGLIGYISNSEVRECYSNNSLVSGSVGFTGGLIGQSINSLIIDTYSWSNIEAYFSGGLIGFLTEGFTSVHNSYSTGNVLGQTQSGGLVGIVYVEDINNSFTTSVMEDYANGYMIAGVIGSAQTSYLFENIYWYDHYDGNLSCFTYMVGEEEFDYSDENCISLNDLNGIEYFYDASNAPLNTWDFENIWQEQENDYPVFAWSLNNDDNEQEEENETNVNKGSSSSTLKVTTKGIFNNIKLNQIITFIIDKSGHRNTKHKLIIKDILIDENKVNFDLYSLPTNYTLSVGEELKKDYDDDNFYDLSVKLISITNNKANFELKAIHEEILLEELVETIIETETITETETKEIINVPKENIVEEKPVVETNDINNTNIELVNEKSYWYIWLIVIIIAFGLIGYFYFRR
jgi:hypothetical protein